jgi:hypothetical protein
LPVVLVFALVASAIGATGTAARAASTTSTGPTTTEPGASTTAAAKRKNRAPVIVQATMRDSDGNLYADSIDLVCNRKVRHKPDADGTFPFSIGDGYTITEVGRAQR